MQITPEIKPISEIFSIEGSTKYTIPIYQRSYSWGYKQIETLINDIKNEDNGYYIGNLLVTTNDDNEVEIVDGQQRLTTIALIYLAIYEHTKDFDKSNDLGKGSIQMDIKRKLLEGGEYPNQKYVMLSDDNDIYIDLLKILDNKPTGKWGNRRFGKRYKEIKSIINEELKTFSDLNAFLKKVNTVEILKIQVSKMSDAFSIFSSLNSKGLPLTLVDLLKNEYLREADIEGKDQDQSLEQWENLVSKFKIEDDLIMKDVTQFLLNNYDGLESKKNASITKSKALDIYIDLIKKNSSNYINTLSERAEWFTYLKNTNGQKYENEDINTLVRELDYLDPSQAFPLLLYLFIQPNYNLNLTENDIIRILKDITKFFIKRNITLRPKASNVRSMFIGLNRHINENNLHGEEIVNIINIELEEKADSIEEMKDKLISDGIYDKNSRTTRYLLIQLERKYGDSFTKANPDNLEEYVTLKKSKKETLRWTIEHILPQSKTLSKYWQNQLSPEDSTDYNKIQEEYVHKIGNLTLTPYNSELGQSDFATKRDKKDGDNYVGLRSNLFLNKSINPTNIEWNKKNNWNTADIDRRSEYFAEKIEELLS